MVEGESGPSILDASAIPFSEGDQPDIDGLTPFDKKILSFAGEPKNLPAAEESKWILPNQEHDADTLESIHIEKEITDAQQDLAIKKLTGKIPGEFTWEEGKKSTTTFVQTPLLLPVSTDETKPENIPRPSPRTRIVLALKRAFRVLNGS